MKNLILISATFLWFCSLSINAQTNKPKLNQVDLSRKLAGVWQQQTANDTAMWFEMTFYKNAVLETMYQTVKGVKELVGAISFIYDPVLDKFKGFWTQPDGRLDSYFLNFTSDNEVVWGRVEDFKSNNLIFQNKFIFPDKDHLNGTHYSGDGIQWSTSKWARIISGIDNEAQINEVALADNQFSQGILNRNIENMSAWYVDSSIMIFPDGTAENGKNAILKGWSDAFNDINFSVKRRLNDVRVPENGVAYTIGSWERKESNAEGKVMTVTGKYFESWIKQKDGRWKVLVINLK